MHFTEVTRIAQQAWDKTKDKSDPVWNECDPHHRQVFLATAQAVVDTGHAVNDFEAAVKRLAQEAQEKSVSIAEVQAENPTAHGDEVQAIAAESKPNVPQINPPSSESDKTPQAKASAKSPRKKSSKKASK